MVMNLLSPTNERLRALLREIAATGIDEIDCGQFLESMSVLLDEAEPLSEDLRPEIDAVRDHLAVCPECLAVLQPLLAAMERAPSMLTSP